MDEVKVETGVDELISYLKTQGKVSLADASAYLKIPEKTLQLWLDFLVEERIVGVEYKFTKPYIFLNGDQKEHVFGSVSNDDITLDTFKTAFFENAKQKQMPDDKIYALWQAHLTEFIEKQLPFFMIEANKRSINEPEKVFAAYKQRLLEM